MNKDLTTEEGNKLIAKFMGCKMDDKCVVVTYPLSKEEDYLVGVYNFDQLKYDFSWDWLMPVVEKISKMKYRVKINSNHIDTSVIIQGVEDSDSVLNIMYYSKPIEAIYTAVVQFIQWYNTQNK